jgi:hypothetical protein
MGGMRDDGKVMLIASTKLTRAVLRIERKFKRSALIDYLNDGPPSPIGTTCDLTVTMPMLTVVIADTYEEALRDLFARWSPTGEPQKALGQGSHAIGLA